MSVARNENCLNEVYHTAGLGFQSSGITEPTYGQSIRLPSLVVSHRYTSPSFESVWTAKLLK